MIPPTTGGADNHAPTATQPTAGRLAELTDELRALYTDTFQLTLRDAETAGRRFETPDGTGPIDPLYAADTAGCRAINRHLATIIRRHLPGAHLIDRIDEPAVIDSSWLQQQRVIDIYWDYSLDFGDAEALTVIVR